MQKYTKNQILRQIRKDFQRILSDAKTSKGSRADIRNQQHLLRAVCLTVLNAERELEFCSKDDDGRIVILDDAYDYCELAGFSLSENSLEDFLSKESLRQNLSYADVSCLIPSMIFSCIRGYCYEKVDAATLFRSLRVLHDRDGSDLAMRFAKAEEVLLQDRFYPQLDEESKQLYRSKISKLARKRGKDERKTAVELLKRARKEDAHNGHLGTFLFRETNRSWYFLFFSILYITLSLVLLGIVKNLLLLILSLIPLFACTKLLCDSVVSRIVVPKIMPKIKITEENCPVTLVTVVSLIQKRADVEKLLHRLDVLAQRIPLSAIRVGMLLDLPSAKVPLTIEEEELIHFLNNEIEKRNKNSNRYFCAIRKRNEIIGEYRYEAHGRKQGAMMDFADLTAGQEDAFYSVCGSVRDGVYFVALDSDTEPTLNSIESLIGFLEHPNHKPLTAKDKQGFLYVLKGYGAAAPRIEANPETSLRTPYGALLAGNTGTELYRNPHCNIYQDLFSEGIFCGKGILNLKLYREIISHRFRDHPQLSHDHPEGHYLRCANLTDLVFFDEIPDNVLSDEKRTHRWMRGDVQNLPLLLKKNKRSNMFFFQILHNLVRVLHPTACFFLIASSVFIGPVAILLSLIWLCVPFVLRLPSLLIRLFQCNRYVNPFRTYWNGFVELLFSFLLLPTHAANGLDAFLRSVFRMLRRKNLLEWTTAAGTAKSGQNVGDYFYGLKYQQVGFLFLFLPYTAPIGILWMLAPVFAHKVSLPFARKKLKTEELRNDLASMWQYYSDLMNEQNNFLPPDNYQQEPLNSVALRTSPTNIGFALLSVLGAYDLNLIGEEELYYRVENTLTTIEKLPKWKGHLYNWYDIRSLKVLPPKFVSTVDSGNWAAALFTLMKGLQGFSTPRADDMVHRINVLLEELDFSVLYNEKRNLFSIGYHVSDGALSKSHYDLYSGEARLTSYYAIMTHSISSEHWKYLARPAKKRHGRLILPGWSGTMFEFLMPHIFLPVYRNTLCGELLKGVLSEQMRFTGKKIPWGVSESGYYTFDSALNYQYRAFGVPSLALRRDVSFPKIISPYSSYLIYPWFPAHASRNLERFSRGKYGCYESVDYRQGDENPRVVQSFMAHHVGMAFLSGVNVICNNIMQRRFMNTEGEAYVSLLTETVPVCSNHRFVEGTEEQERWKAPEQRIDKPDPDHPSVKLITNGEVSEVISDSGDGYMRQNDICLTAPPNGVDCENGIFLFVRNKGEIHGVTYAPLYDEQAQYHMFYDAAGASCYGIFREFETRLSVTLHHDLPIFLRELTIKNNLVTENSFEIYLFLHPILCQKSDYEAHSEYKALFVTAEYDSVRHIVCFKRTTQAGEKWFSVAVPKGFVFDVRRDSFGRFSEISYGKTEGACPYPVFPALVLKGSMHLRGRGSDSVLFAFGVGNSKESSISGLSSAVMSDFEQMRRKHAQATEAQWISMNIQASDLMILDRTSSSLLYPLRKPAAIKKAENTLPKSTLWKYGISGDYPILSLRVGEENTEGVLSFVKVVCYMMYAGISVDLLILYRESDGYFSPIKTALETLLEEQPSRIRDRLFLLNIHSVEEYLFFQKTSSFFLNLERGWKWTSPHRSFRPMRMLPPPENNEKPALSLGRGGYCKNGAYAISKSGQNPLRPWSLVLANNRFGTVINERSLGFTFAYNASENRITPRLPLPSYSLGGERLYLVSKGKRYDLISSAIAELSPYKMKYQSDFSGCRITTEVLIPPYLCAKIIRVTLSTLPSVPFEIVYEPQIIMGKAMTDTVTRFSEDGIVFFRNAYNEQYRTGNTVLFGINTVSEGGLLRFCPSEQTLRGVFVLGYGCGNRSAKRLADLLTEEKRIEKEERKARKKAAPFLKLDSPDKELNYFVNGFLQQQILQSRVLGRTGSSQPGGAFGFRDQLQDAICLASFDPRYLKHQLLRCASHQFEEGDVLHWWHPRWKGADDGIRSRYSDDPFWLVFACGEYYKTTQDLSLFNHRCRYLKGAPLGEDEKDRYFVPEKTDYKESLYLHAMKAFRCGYKTGAHGMILFGSGDWNDGMNGVGDGSETVWGTLFAVLSATVFLPVAESIGGEDDLQYLLQCVSELTDALKQYGTDGSGYLRGYRGDGFPIGGANFASLIPQAFAVFCNLDGSADGLNGVLDVLWDSQNKILRLFAPPYTENGEGFPGSIASYPPGVRENGGQYTHAAVWFVRALYLAGKTELANEIFLALNPVTKNRTGADVRKYGGEPYVMPADVYALKGREGFCGWTHYTGAAGWYLKTLTENLLGIERNGDFITVKPSLPIAWNGCRAEVTVGNDLLKIRIERGSDMGMFENGEKVSRISLSDSVHEISIIV